MSEARASTVLNWRGPLLAAGIFAAAFAILLLMAQRNESSASDAGSSLREDPYGTSLIFDAYRRAGYQVIRSEDEDALSDQNAARTTAFFIGGAMFGDWDFEAQNSPLAEKFRARLEAFLAQGGRAVLVDPRWSMKSDAQGWEFKKEWGNPGPHETFEPQWLAPSTEALPKDAEGFYLAARTPWLTLNRDWTPLYAIPASQDSSPTPIVYMAARSVGKGELIVASQQWFLMNEAIKTRPNPNLLDFLAGGRPVIWVDETLHGLHQERGVIWLVQRYRLQAALILFWATLLLLLWSMSGDLVRRPERSPSARIVREGEGSGIAARYLVQRSIPKTDVVMECWEQFRRRSPQEAQAISADAVTGPELRAALGQTPLSGYKELSRMIAERRAALRKIGQASHTESRILTASSPTLLKEGRKG